MELVDVKVSASEFFETMELISELPDIVSQIESCKFSCEAGSIEMNESFIRLKEILSHIESGLTPRALDAKQPPAFCGRCGSTTCTCKYGPYPVLRQ